LPTPHCSSRFTAPVPSQISTLSLHDALPIWSRRSFPGACHASRPPRLPRSWAELLGEDNAQPEPAAERAGLFSRLRDSLSKSRTDRKSTRLNSSHQIISYAVFCLKKQKNNTL